MLGNLNIGSLNGAGFMPINLVINPEFTVNQRGAASRTAATGYNYDRWYYDGSSLLQGIENLNLRNTTYVVSWSGAATCSYSLNTAASSSQGGQTFTSIANGGTLTISSLGSNNLWLKFSGTVSDLTNVMCVPSPAQTPFIPRQYQQELALCQRYYWKTYNQSVVPGASGNNQAGAVMVYVPAAGNTVRCTMPFKVNMRTAPTLTLYNPETGAAGYAGYEGSGAANQVALGQTFTSEYSALIYATAAGFTGSLYWQAIGVAEL